MPIKNLITKMATDKLFVKKLSNPIQKDDFKLEARKTYKKDKADLLSKFRIMLDIFFVRKNSNKESNRESHKKSYKDDSDSDSKDDYSS